LAGYDHVDGLHEFGSYRPAKDYDEGVCVELIVLASALEVWPSNIRDTESNDLGIDHG